jgi:hypothetical protein
MLRRSGIDFGENSETGRNEAIREEWSSGGRRHVMTAFKESVT